MTDIQTILAKLRDGISRPTTILEREELALHIEALLAKVEQLERERDEAERLKCAWFETHLAHRDANEALGKANGKLLERAIDAERRAEASERLLAE